MDAFGPSDEDVASLKELAELLADLNPHLELDDDDAILTVRADPRSTVDATAFDGGFSLGMTFEFEDGGGTNDIVVTMATSEIVQAAKWVRSTLLDMPTLRAEAEADHAAG